MLVLTRKKDQRTIITVPGYEPIAVTVVRVKGDIVRLGFSAPPEVTIHREEVQSRLDADAA